MKRDYFEDESVYSNRGDSIIRHLSLILIPWNASIFWFITSTIIQDHKWLFIILGLAILFLITSNLLIVIGLRLISDCSYEAGIFEQTGPSKEETDKFNKKQKTEYDRKINFCNNSIFYNFILGIIFSLVFTFFSVCYKYLS